MSTSSTEKVEPKSALEHAIRAWEDSKEGQYTLQSVKVTEIVFGSIATGRPVSVQEFADQSGGTLKETEILFRKMRLSGADFDEDGRLIGNALTMRPTPHVFQVDGRPLYAWCALDTLFLPGLIGKTAKVQSLSPASGNAIRLTVSPSGVEEFDPTEAVLSVVVPGVSKACEPGQRGGASGAVCNSMHFLTSHEEAAVYLGPDTDVSIMTVEEASELAQRAWVRPYRSALDAASSR